MVSQEEFENEVRQKEFYRTRLEAAEAKISLMQRGFSVDEQPKPKKELKDVVEAN